MPKGSSNSIRGRVVSNGKERRRRKLAEMVEEELKGELTAKEREVFGRIHVKLPDGDPWVE
jgi:hypothetical protein